MSNPLDILYVNHDPSMTSRDEATFIIPRKGLEKIVEFLKNIINNERDEFAIVCLSNDGLNPVTPSFRVFVKSEHPKENDLYDLNKS